MNKRTRLPQGVNGSLDTDSETEDSIDTSYVLSAAGRTSFQRYTVDKASKRPKPQGSSSQSTQDDTVLVEQGSKPKVAEKRNQVSELSSLYQKRK